MKKKAEKVTQAENLRKQLATVSTVILSTFQGITVEQDTKLRRSVEAAGGHYQVVKNRVAQRAGEGTPAEGLLKGLKGTNSICVHEDRPGRAREDSDQSREGCSGVPVPRGIGWKGASFRFRRSTSSRCFRARKS